jgi:segregation and condensation protein A
MAYTFRLPEFEGPLDLLLQLIERAELDITSIALASVADEYLAHVRALEERDLRALADFLAIAARLLLIKSRALLPRPTTPGAQPAPDPTADELAAQLRHYQQYKRAAALLREWAEADRQLFVRNAPPPPLPPLPEQPLGVAGDLIAALERRLMLLRSEAPRPTAVVLPPRLTVRQVAAQVRERLAWQQWFAFDDLLSLAATRQEVIVSLWAVLEMLKRGAVVVQQPILFGPIRIGRGPRLDTPQALPDDDPDPAAGEVE